LLNLNTLAGTVAHAGGCRT